MSESLRPVQPEGSAPPDVPLPEWATPDVTRPDGAAADDGERENSLFDSRFEALYERLASLPDNLADGVQSELSLILDLLPGVVKRRDLGLLYNTELAISSLLLARPNLILAKGLRESCEQSLLRRQLYDRGFFRSVAPGTSASTWVVAGLAAMLCVAVPISATLFLFLPDDLQWRTGLGCALMGAVGSMVSMLVRIKDFTEIRNINPPGLFWTGFFKPVIGAAFAVFVYLAIDSNVLNGFSAEIKSVTFFLTFAFVAGFSERVAPDLVSKLEGSVGKGASPH